MRMGKLTLLLLLLLLWRMLTTTEITMLWELSLRSAVPHNSHQLHTEVGLHVVSAGESWIANYAIELYRILCTRDGTMNWLRVSQNSAPLYRSSEAVPSEDDVDAKRCSADRQTFFNHIENIFNTTPKRFCLPHQVLDIKIIMLHIELIVTVRK